MTWSLNEVDSLSKKAARGSGMSWGLAEEAGKAARGLCEYGFDGPENLLSLLRDHDNLPNDDIAPKDHAGVWSAAKGGLCPVAAGAALCDLAYDIARDAPLQMKGVVRPLLLLPFVQGAVAQSGRDLCLCWDGVQLHVSRDGVQIAGRESDLDCAQAPMVQVRAGLAREGQVLARAGRARMAQTTAAQLGEYAQRTYAPDTEASRLKGAGSNLSDND